MTRSAMDFVPTLLGAVLLWDFFARVMQGVTTAFLEDVWSRNFLNLFASPLSIPEYVAGLVAPSVMTSAIGLVVMIALASGIFGLSFFSYGLLLFPFLLILFVFGIAMGVVASAIVLGSAPRRSGSSGRFRRCSRHSPACSTLSSTLPRWMQAVAFVLPPASVFDSMRRSLQETPCLSERSPGAAASHSSTCCSVRGCSLASIATRCASV